VRGKACEDTCESALQTPSRSRAQEQHLLFLADDTLDPAMHSMTTPNPLRIHARDPATHEAGRSSHLTSWVALVALLGASIGRCAEMHRRRRAAKPDAKPEKLQVWEDEGGQNQMPGAPN
jgi:hypothetical protein